ncbi:MULTISPECIES: ABC transporter permease [Frankia]|uniref:ABC-type dipeptide/oligopeptide/nickel transport systems, permease component n=1 Tax=Frankia alni (strain DSM 45986 / CECT 9034 / ACN14a) TaxID=326424 RepID=Q0RJ08_FRAAA|nr:MULTISPECIES: ABC transporter permease [Frankia]CAJ62507.1 putative ABC-type dipeptide/oligopeptide/nickel transport systems, permease component [Frankia alni ACN14a]
MPDKILSPNTDLVAPPEQRGAVARAAGSATTAPPVLTPAGIAQPGPATAPAGIAVPADVADPVGTAEPVGTATLTSGDAGADGQGRRRRHDLLAAAGPLLRRPGFVLAALFVVFVILSGLAPGLFTSYKPSATSPVDKLKGPSLHHLFGTDELGRDLFSRVLHGSTLTIKATGGAVLIAIVAGLAIGVVAGFFGGWVDSLLMRIVDILLAIPMLLMALVIVTALGFGLLPIAIAVGTTITPTFARTTRAEVLRVKEQPYVEAARTGGASWGRVLVRHILPNSWGPVSVLAVLDFGTAVLVVSSLSFLGFGTPPPAAEWGTLISNGRNFLITSPWLSLLPGLFVGLVVFSLNHIARTLEEMQR